MRKTALIAAIAVVLGSCSNAPEHRPRARASAVPTTSVPTTPAPPKNDRPRGGVLVYQLVDGRNGYRPGDYRAARRPAPGARGAGERLQVALQELVEGPTRAERRAGLVSAFGDDTADILLRVELRGRRAVVDFRDFRRERPEWSTSNGGSIFLMQLSRTVFQFDHIDSALFRIDRNCRKLWEFLQVVKCDTVRATPALRTRPRR